MTDNRIIVDLEHVTNTCFVVMPFHSLFETEYERVIRPAIEEAGLECVRGDEIYTEQAIVQDIWKSIRQSRVVVAELSGRNPNVMYEIGLAHAIGKPIVLITRNQEDVPFDLRALRYIYYDPNNPFWGEDLRSELTKIIHKVLETPTLAAHLGGITVQAILPEAPKQPLSPTREDASGVDFSGVWNTSWLSIRNQREHKATLVIPPEHGRNFMANMTITYIRDEQRTVVQETLAGTTQKALLSLTGVNYTYVEQGNSRSYSLDSFEVELSDDGKALIGEAILKYGTREVAFRRVLNLSHARI
jgi:hypothetical protein